VSTFFTNILIYLKKKLFVRLHENKLGDDGMAHLLNELTAQLSAGVAERKSLRRIDIGEKISFFFIN
jgi:hypothetical protein